jgi:hypothetical protein
MAKGGQRDSRETFVVDTLRLRNKGKVPTAPQAGAIEFYFRDRIAYWLDEDGVEHAFGGFGTSASPGFTWGRSGTVGTGVYLLNDNVPSNVSGRVVALTQPTIRKILVTNGSVGTFTLTIQEHDGVTYTNLTSVSLSSQRTATFSVEIPVTTGKQLAIKVTSGSADNPVVGVILDGNY